MKEVKFTLYDEDKTLIVEDNKEYFNKIYSLLTNDDKNDLMIDAEKFLKDLTTSIKPAVKKIYEVITHVRGYDTYDGAVVIAYSEEQAIDIAFKKFSPTHNFDRNYENMDAEEIGIATPDSKIGFVLVSFNAG